MSMERKEKDPLLVRRVAGGPGDKVEIKDDIFYLNDKPYEKHMVEAVPYGDR